MSLVSIRSVACVVLLLPSLASASLRDHGPVDPVTGFPTWYRDTSRLPLEPCFAQTPSPNAAAGGAPMCFPVVPNPLGFPGNFGDEAFYTSATALVNGAPGVSGLLDLALEAAYAQGPPIRGDEMVFGRIRIRIDVATPGTYVVTHPYGVEVFPDVQPGVKAINFTQDIGVAPGQFDGALGARMGPFLTWDRLDPGESLTIRDANGNVLEEYVGDPNYAHTVTGSPFNTNFFRIEGPPGSNLDGNGNSFLETSVFQLLGKKYLTPIPTALALNRVSYSRTATHAGLDILATSEPGAVLVASGAGMTPVTLRGDGLGRFFAHVDFPATSTLPGSVTVTNTTDSPPSSKTTGVTDIVTARTAVFDVATSTVSVTAETSDRGGAPPALNALGVGAMTPGAQAWIASAALAIPTGVPPLEVRIVSSAGGQDVIPVDIVNSAPQVTSAPIAIDDALTTDESVPASVAVTANDVVFAPATFSRLLVMTAPLHGTATVNPTDPSLIDYAPTPGYFGADSFTYTLEDSTGALSNTATVRVTVNRTTIAPIANDDTASTRVGAGAIVINVLANDTAAHPPLNTATIIFGGRPQLGTAVANPDGTISYTARAAGTDAFSYAVQDAFGVLSNFATVRVTVQAAADALSVIRLQYIRNKAQWRIDGTSNTFGPGINNQVLIHNGPTIASPVIGTAQIDALGAFTWTSPRPSPAPDVTQLVTLESTGGGVLTAPVTLK
jgi:hypothetical protein